MNNATDPTSALFASSLTAAGGGFSWVTAQVAMRGVDLSLLPPLLFSAASLVSAVVAGYRVYCEARNRELDAAQERRHREDLHKIDVESARRREHLD